MKLIAVKFLFLFFLLNIELVYAQPLTANFTTANTNFCSGTCIDFIDLSTGTGVNPISYSWTFQGGSPISSFDQNPINICYNTVGTFFVTLTINDGVSTSTLTIPGFITVTSCNGPTAGFIVNINSGCINDCLTFTDQSQNASTWGWGFPGGTPNVYIGQNPPQICYSSTGVYDVVQYVADANGNTDTLNQVGYINISNCPLPVAGFSSISTSGCVNSCFTFIDQSQNSTAWSWGFPGGIPNSFIGQNPPQVCYSTPGVYDVAQYVVDANGHTDTLIQFGYITISNCPPPIADFTVSATNGCVNDCFTFTDQSQNATTWGWGFPGGNPNFFIGQNPPQICYSAAGTYDVAQYVADANGNTDTLIQAGYITIVNCNEPTAGFNASATSSCNNDSISFTDASLNATFWSWTFNGGTPSTFIGQNPPPIHYQTPGIYDVLLVVTNANGIDSLLQSAFITINYCGGLLVQFSASDTFICAGECISFADLSFGNPIGWVWTLPGGSPDTVTAQNPPYVCYQNAGVFPVTLIAFDSTSSDTVTYTNYITVVNGTPVMTNLDSTTIFAGTPIQLIASGGVSYSWDNGYSLDNDSFSSPIATPYDTTVYNVTMIDANGCSSVKSILINVIPPETVWAPTAFTPNNDKNNDIFYIKPGGIIINYELRIFDRWGELIFESKDPTAGWDGTYLNTKLNVGVYVYYYNIEFIDGAILENSGDVTLLR